MPTEDLEFYQKRATKAPCFSCGDEVAQKLVDKNWFISYNSFKELI